MRSKGREAWEDAKEEGEEFVESAKARGRQGWERTKQEWEHLKETVSPGTGMVCPALPCSPCAAPALPCPTVYWTTLQCVALPCPALLCSAWLYQTLPHYTQTLSIQTLRSGTSSLSLALIFTALHYHTSEHDCCF